MPDDRLRERFVRAFTLEGEMRFDEAEAVCREILAERPKQAQTLCLLGRIQRRGNRLDEAAASLQRAANLAPRLPQVAAERGFLALSCREPAAAVRYFSLLLELKPQASDTHFNLACALEMAGRYAEAAEHFERALALSPAASHEVLARLGGSLLMCGKEPAAAARFAAALELDRRYAPALYGLGMVSSAQGEFEAAADLFRRALVIDPAFAEAYQQIAEIRRFERPDDPDLVAMRELLERPELSPLAREKLCFALGKAHDDLGAYDEAFGFFAQANRLKRERVPRFDGMRHRRLVDRIIDTFSATFFAERAEWGSPSNMPVLIFGMPRSGTTLVEQMLSSHSGVAGAGEQTHFERSSRSAGEAWPETVIGWGAGDVERAAREYLELLDGFAGGAGRVTDKLPANFVHLGLIRLLFPRAALIHCRRDAVDTCLSIYFQDFGTANYYANDLEDIALYYREYARLMRHWHAVLPGAIHDVDHAALVRDQERAMRELLEFCGLEWEEACLDFTSNARVVSTLSRWQVRQPIYPQSLGRRENYAPHIGVLERALASKWGHS